jgi:hypothetical protein
MKVQVAVPLPVTEAVTGQGVTVLKQAVTVEGRPATLRFTVPENPFNPDGCGGWSGYAFSPLVLCLDFSKKERQNPSDRKVGTRR